MRGVTGLVELLEKSQGPGQAGQLVPSGQIFVDDIDIATPGLGSAQQRAEQEFAEDQDLGSTGPDYTDEPTTERHRYIALLQYADSLDQELLQRQLLNTAEAGASAGATIRERVPPERVAAMSTSQLQRINDQIEDVFNKSSSIENNLNSLDEKYYKIKETQEMIEFIKRSNKRGIATFSNE